jgi:uncharacterized cupredoxin-like copper-binding protein
MHNVDPHKSTRPSFTASALFALSLAATGPVSAAGEHGGGHDDNGGGHSVAFGSPADASEADRTITVTARDTMVFSPDAVAIGKGTTVRFVIENVGQLQHSFTLATSDAAVRPAKMCEARDHGFRRRDFPRRIITIGDGSDPVQTGAPARRHAVLRPRQDGVTESAHGHRWGPSGVQHRWNDRGRCAVAQFVSDGCR